MTCNDKTINSLVYLAVKLLSIAGLEAQPGQCHEQITDLWCDVLLAVGCVVLETDGLEIKGQ